MTKFGFNNTKDPTIDDIRKVIDKQNHYQRLGVSFDATQDDIKKAYRKLANKYHPDRNPDFQESATYIMARISDAYDILSNVEKRKNYDLQITSSSHPNTSTNKNAYDSYTKPREETEKDFEDHIKDYLKTRRKLNELYNTYIHITLKNFQILENIKPHDITKSFLNDLFLQYILTQAINTLLESMYSNNDINPVRILMILFTELEHNNCEFYNGHITEKNCLFILLTEELKALIDIYTDRNNKDFEKTILYLLTKYLSTLDDINYSGRTTYRTVVCELLKPIIETNKDVISSLLKKYGRH